MAQDFTTDPRVYLAAERTFLAWIRTGLALMGFGFVVARFGLFLRELSASRLDLNIKSSDFSTGIGIALILIGVITNVVATLRHLQVIGKLKRGDEAIARPSYAAIAVALTLAVLGAAIVVYMSFIR